MTEFIVTIDCGGSYWRQSIEADDLDDARMQAEDLVCEEDETLGSEHFTLMDCQEDSLSMTFVGGAVKVLPSWSFLLTATSPRLPRQDRPFRWELFHPWQRDRPEAHGVAQRRAEQRQR